MPIPHSIPRKIQFLVETLKILSYLDLPRIKLFKRYVSGIPVAQKTLSKIKERIANARSTIIVPYDIPKFARVLLIDDAVGSGATLNETAIKLRNINPSAQIIGYAIVGSYKGFEVIREV